MPEVATSERTPPKQAFGTPCNGCGLCCAAEPCAIARQFIGAAEDLPCPALEFEAGRFWCGMIRRPGHYLGAPPWADAEIGDTVARALGAGRDCCAGDA